MNVQATGSLQRHVGSLSIIVYGNQTSVYEAWVTQEGQSSGPPTSFRLFSLSLSCLRATVARRSAEWRSGCCKAEIHYPNKYMQKCRSCWMWVQMEKYNTLPAGVKGEKKPYWSQMKKIANLSSLFLFTSWLSWFFSCSFFFFYCTLFSYFPLSRPLLRNIGEFFFPIRIFAHSIQG